MKINNSEKNKSFFKPIIQLASGSLIAQIITIVVSPISTRLYSTEELGTYTLLLTSVAIFGPILSLRYDTSIVTSRNKEEEFNLVFGSLIIGFVFSVLVTIGYSIYLNKNGILSEIGNSLAILLFFLLIINCFINILSAYNNKNKEYKTLSQVYVSRTFFQNFFLVIFGIFKLGSLGLLLSQIIGSLVGLKKQLSTIIKEKELFKLVTLKGIKKILKTERKQFLFSTPATLLNTSSYSILNFFITGLFGIQVFGYYSMAYRILGLPLTLISTNMSKVFFQQAADEYKESGSYNTILKKYSVITALVAIPMVIGLMLFSPIIFEIFFGEGWGVSGEYIRILAPMFGIRLVVSTVSMSLIISQKQQVEFILQSSFIFVSISAYMLCKIFNYDEFSFFTIISILYSLIYIVFYLVIYKISKQKRVEI